MRFAANCLRASSRLRSGLIRYGLQGLSLFVTKDHLPLAVPMIHQPDRAERLARRIDLAARAVGTNPRLESQKWTFRCRRAVLH